MPPNKKLLTERVVLGRIVSMMTVFIVMADNYGPEPIKNSFVNNERITTPYTRPILVFCTIHLLVCWNVSIFIYNVLIDATYLEIRHFNSRILDARMDLETELVNLISAHSHISRTVSMMDGLFKVYSFIMVAVQIPSILLTMIYLGQFSNDIATVLLFGIPVISITIYGFLGITMAPARLYEEMLRSKACLCQNAAVWKPYNKQIYRLAMVLCTHLEQPNLGMTIWGFAMLSKPLILATFSVMLMVLSLVLDIAPQIEEKFAQALMNSTNVYDE